VSKYRGTPFWGLKYQGSLLVESGLFLYPGIILCFRVKDFLITFMLGI